MWHSGDGMGWWMLFGSMWFLIFWALVLWVVFRLVDKRNGAESRQDSALDILRRRYARGEISKEQYDQIKEDLR